MPRQKQAATPLPAKQRAASARASRRRPSQSPAAFLDEASDLATTLILERGYDNTPMSAIAKALGLTKAGVYHHVDSKEDLLYAVHRRSLDHRLLPILTAAEAVKNPEQRLRSFLFEFALLMTRDPAARILITETRRLSRARTTEVRNAWRRVYKLLRDSIALLQQRGRCRTDIDPGFAAFSAIGSCCWILFWFDYKRPESGEAVATTVSNVLLSGLLKPSKSKTA